MIFHLAEFPNRPPGDDEDVCACELAFPFERFEVYGRHSTYETFEMERISFTDGLETKTTTFDFSLASMHEKWGYIEEDRLFVDALDGKSPLP